LSSISHGAAHSRYPAGVSALARLGAAHDPGQRQDVMPQAQAHARAEQANAVLNMTFKARRHVSLDPRMIGLIVAAAVVLLHVEHERTL
jgi:hypothetical protein